MPASRTSSTLPTKQWIDASPWDTEEQFYEDLERAWKEMKQQGLEKGILTIREDGALIGKGHPDKWFDAV
jgi:hypothetical protein